MKYRQRLNLFEKSKENRDYSLLEPLIKLHNKDLRIKEVGRTDSMRIKAKTDKRHLVRGLLSVFLLLSKVVEGNA
jgi:hypothetical protein